MERSMSLLTFKGSISEAIMEAKKQRKLFLVYVSGEDGDSIHLEQSTWMDLNVADSISKYCIFLHLTYGSIDASQFSAIYPQKSVPCTTAIGYNGVQLWQHEGYVSSENLVSSIEKAWLSLQIQETTATFLTAALASNKPELLSSSSSNVALVEDGSFSSCDLPSCSTDKPLQNSEIKPLLISELSGESRDCEPKIEIEETYSQSIQANELKSGQDEQSTSASEATKNCLHPVAINTLQDEQSASASETAKNSLHPVAVNLGSSEAESGSSGVGDGCTVPRETVTPNDLGSKAPLGSSQITANDAENNVQNKKTDGVDNCINVSKSNDVHLNIRMPDGASLQKKFSVTDSLRLVKDYVDENQMNGIGSYDLAIPYPRKIFYNQDLSKALVELGLSNRQALIVVPHHVATGSHRGQSLSGNQANAASNVDPLHDSNGGYFGYAKKILSYINPFSYLGGSANSSNSGQASNDGLWQFRPNPTLQNQFSSTERPYRIYSPNSNAPSTEENSNKSRKPTSSRFGSNIHTLRHDEDDGPSQDRNTFWNGNSTEYGGDNNGK